MVAGPPARDVAPRDAADLLRAGAAAVDVREPEELATGRIAGARNVPMSEFAARAGEIDPDRAVVLYCRSGSRSALAADALRAAGREAYSVAGGIEAWEADGLPLEGK